MNKGWICPRCNNSLSPSVISCPYCGPSTQKYFTKEENTTGTPLCKNPTVTISSSENDLSWREWLDEMRAANWRFNA